MCALVWVDEEAAKKVQLQGVQGGPSGDDAVARLAALLRHDIAENCRILAQAQRATESDIGGAAHNLHGTDSIEPLPSDVLPLCWPTPFTWIPNELSTMPHATVWVAGTFADDRAEACPAVLGGRHAVAWVRKRKAADGSARTSRTTATYRPEALGWDVPAARRG